MNDDNTKSNGSETHPELSPSSANIPANRNSNTPKKSNKSSSNNKSRKWDLMEHWNRAPHSKRIKWCVGGVVAFVGLMAGIANIRSCADSEANFAEESRPRITISRPPEMTGTFACQVTDRAVHFKVGPTRAWVKNSGRDTAISAFMAGPQFQLVPDAKTGYPIVDNGPSITEKTCKTVLDPSTRIFPVHGNGEEVSAQMKWACGITSLINANKVTCGVEPEPPPGEKITQKIPLTNNSKFRLYAPICVFYMNKSGQQWGTCQNYILALDAKTGNLDNHIFSCSDTPITGTLEPVFGSYCDE